MVTGDNDDHLLSHAVRETLDAVVSPSVRDALLNEALANARAAELPREPDEFKEFLDGPLRKALVKALGTELGDSVAVELERLAEVASSRRGLPPQRRTRSGQLRGASAAPRRRPTPSPRAEWPSSHLPPRSTLKSAAARPASPVSPTARTLRPPGRETQTPTAAPPPAPKSVDPKLLPYTPTLPAAKKPLSSRVPPSSADLPRGTASRLGMAGARADTEPPSGLPLVLVATRELSLARKLSQWVDPRASVQRVTALGSLLRQVEDAGNARIVIVVDCNSPSVRAKSLAAVVEELSPWVQVVLWGASPAIEREIALISPLTSEWLIVGNETTAKDLALRCAALVG
jgi:hypothetical protein